MRLIWLTFDLFSVGATSMYIVKFGLQLQATEDSQDVDFFHFGNSEHH